MLRDDRDRRRHSFDDVASRTTEIGGHTKR
jgi:hypothetical protein